MLFVKTLGYVVEMGVKKCSPTSYSPTLNGTWFPLSLSLPLKSQEHGSKSGEFEGLQIDPWSSRPFLGWIREAWIGGKLAVSDQTSFPNPIRIRPSNFKVGLNQIWLPWVLFGLLQTKMSPPVHTS